MSFADLAAKLAAKMAKAEAVKIEGQAAKWIAAGYHPLDLVVVHKQDGDSYVTTRDSVEMANMLATQGAD